MTQLTTELFKRYQTNPLKHDEEVRRFVKVPDNRYYTVSVWPEERAGQVRVNNNVVRIVQSKKISKSSQ